MSRLDIDIVLDNDAFSGDDAGSEIARILRCLANRLDGTPMHALEAVVLKDSNGNHVGDASFDIDEPDEEDPQAGAREAYRKFVDQMQGDDMRTTLEKACDIQCYDSEHRGIWLEALVECLLNGDITTDDIVGFFDGKYSE